MSNRKTQRPARHVPRTPPIGGKSLLVTGLGFFHLPASLDDLEEWRQATVATAPDQEVSDVMNWLGGSMAEAITTGHGAYDDADIGRLVIVHFDDDTTVMAAGRIAAEAGITEAEVWDSIGHMVAAGWLVPCKPGDAYDCRDGGYRAVVPEHARKVGAAGLDRISLYPQPEGDPAPDAGQAG